MQTALKRGPWEAHQPGASSGIQMDAKALSLKLPNGGGRMILHRIILLILYNLGLDDFPINCIWRFVRLVGRSHHWQPHVKVL